MGADVTNFMNRLFLKMHLHDLKSRAESLRRSEIMAKHAAAQEAADAANYALQRETIVREAQHVSTELFMRESGVR